MMSSMFFFMNHVMSAFYVAVATFFTAVDISHKPEWLYKKKIQKVDVTWNDLKTMAPTVVLVGFLNCTVVSYLTQLYFTHMGLHMEIPSWLKLAQDFLLFAIFYDTIFFFWHLFSHQPSVYGWIHKKHHEFKSPQAFEGLYFTLIDFYAGNFGPLILIGPLVTGHFYSIFTFTCLGAVSISLAHCGYDARPIHDPRIHDIHHEY